MNMNDGRGFVTQATFAQRLKQLMELRGAKQADVIRMAQTRGKHLGKSQVSQYVSGKTIPRRDVMDVLAARASSSSISATLRPLVSARPTR